MKKLQPIVIALTVIVFIASCKASSTQQALASTESRQEIMDPIADNEAVSKQMMQTMMNTSTGKMAMDGIGELMMPDHASMMEQMKKDSAMNKSMTSDVMEACEKDSTMMLDLCRKMMDNTGAMNMMQKMKGGKMTMDNMKGMDSTKGTNHKGQQ